MFLSIFPPIFLTGAGTHPPALIFLSGGEHIVAKGKYQEWLEPDGLILLEGWARDGLTDEQIAKNIGITSTTLYDWKKKYSKISEALKKGKEVVDYAVENALLSAAMDGNTAAQIFWLKNRRPDRWREKPKEAPPAEEVNDQFIEALQETATEDWGKDDV